MSDFSSFESEADTTPIRPGQLSSNGQWIAGGVFALLLTVGFGFGLYAGTRKTAPEVAAKPADTEKPAPKPAPQPEQKKIDTEVKPEPKVEPKVEPKIEPKVEPKKPDPKPEPKPKEKEPEPKVTVKPVAFKEIVPILRTSCNNCHGSGTGKPKGGVDLTTIAKMKGSDGMVLVPGNAKDSRLLGSILDESMPKDGKPLNPDDVDKIRNWILSGAKE
jgi:periplasmic protein TonB